MSLLCSSNFGKEILSILNKNQSFGHTTNTNSRRLLNNINIVSATSRDHLQLKNNVANTITTGKDLRLKIFFVFVFFYFSILLVNFVGEFGNIDDHKLIRKLDIRHEHLIRGQLRKGDLVYEHNFLIKSYELDLDNKPTMVSIINQLQVRVVFVCRSNVLVSYFLFSVFYFLFIV